VNAAIGLARQKDRGGFRVFREILRSETVAAGLSQQTASPPSDKGQPAGASAQFDQFLALKNSLLAIEQLGQEFNPEQRQELLPLLTLLADQHTDAKIRVCSRNALGSLLEPR
jgi:hypothetical protein